MWQFKKSRLNYQIEQYLVWKCARAQATCGIDNEWLAEFVSVCKRESVEEITLDDVLKFRERLWKRGTDYALISGMKSVREFLRYYRARKYPVLSPLMVVAR